MKSWQAGLWVLAACVVLGQGSDLLVAQEVKPPTEQSAPAAQETKPEVAPEEKFVIVPAGTQLALVLQNSVNSKSTRPGDYVYFETIFPVVVDNRILIPVGSYVRGQVTQVKRAGRLKGRAELHLRLDELTLPNGYTSKLQASLGGGGMADNAEINRSEGGIKAESTKRKDVEEGVIYGGAGAGLGGAIGGAASGSRKGVGIGMGVGAAAGVAWALLGRGPELFLARGQTLEFVLNRDLALDAELAKFDWTGYSTPMPGPAGRQDERRRLGPRLPY